MKIITLNVNGIRSANNKGLFNWLQSENPDIICLQEIKAQLEDIPAALKHWNNYHCAFHPASKKGYSGVAIYSKFKPQKIIAGIGNHTIDDEGRYLQFDFNNFSVISLYLPSGSSGEAKQANKFKFMDFYQPILEKQLKSNHKYIICGDWNIAHQPIDLKNWKANQKHSGFLKEEREWLDYLFELGFIDIWRTLYPKIAGYTWWSNRGQAYLKDVGWRIDYQICTPNLLSTIKSATIFKDLKFSDHAPLIVQYDL